MDYEVSSGDMESRMIVENKTMAVPGSVPNLADDVLTVMDNPSTILHDGDVLLANAMPEAEYMYGCTPTAVGMILGYYDLYGYLGKDFSAKIQQDAKN